jgi:hypothetical protein
MARISLDDFLDAFSAQLVKRGQHRIRLNDPSVRDGLYRIYKFLDEDIGSEQARADKIWRRSLVNLRNVFQPSPIGSFDRLESLLRAKQVYLTDHPNPYYHDVVIRMSTSAAQHIVNQLDEPSSRLVSSSIDQYLAPQ